MSENMNWHASMRAIGKFEGVIQIAPSLAMAKRLDEENTHELLSEGPATSPAGASGDLTNHGGPVINGGRAKVFNIYLGEQGYNTAQFDQFSQRVVENGYYISPDGLDTSNGKYLASKALAWPFPQMTVDDSQIEIWLDQMVASKQLPAQDGATLYMLMMPVGSTVTMQGSASCSAFCGYHSMTGQGNYFAVINDTNCPGCNSGVALDGRMMVYAHEYTEWRSDPQGNAWSNNSNGQENADECAWQRVEWNNHGDIVQPFWVNGRGCTQGTFVEAGPPPPPPAPKTAFLVMGSQPQGGKPGARLSDFAIFCMLPDGTINTHDSASVISSSLHDASNTYGNTQSVVAANGVATFAGDTMKNPHTGMYYEFVASGLPLLRSDKFDVASAPPPPPPPKGDIVSIGGFSIPIVVNGVTHKLIIPPQDVP